MSLYNMLHGQNPLSSVLLAILGIDQKKEPKWPTGNGEVPFDNWFEDKELAEGYVKTCIECEHWPSGRFRDIYLNVTEIILYTRCGGGNRGGYSYIFDIL